MHRLGFAVVYGLLYALSCLPLWWHYAVSSWVFTGLLYRIIGYRKQIVRNNLANALPERSETERRTIERAFYRQFVDAWLETLKLLSAPRRFLAKRWQFSEESYALMQQLAASHRNYIVAMAHLGNWEWMSAGYDEARVKGDFFSLYEPLRSRVFDRLMLRLRTRFGVQLVPGREAVKKLVSLANTGAGFVFIADQAGMAHKSYWTTFLHQEAPVFPGIEKLARKFDMPVLYAWMHKPVRGHYQVHLELLTDTPTEQPDTTILEAYCGRLAQNIQQQPALWLWSHRRWKRTRPDEKPLGPTPEAKAAAQALLARMEAQAQATTPTFRGHP